MQHTIEPFKEQINRAIDRNDPQAAASAIEIRFPATFSFKAWRVIRYFGEAMFLYLYKDKLVVTDEGLELTDYGDGTAEAPYGGPRWVGENLNELELWLESIADEYDASEIEILGWKVQEENDAPTLNEDGKIMNETIKKQILEIRRSGEVNMLDARTVQSIANREGYYELVVYLEEHRDKYAHFIFTGEES